MKNISVSDEAHQDLKIVAAFEVKGIGEMVGILAKEKMSQIEGVIASKIEGQQQKPENGQS